LQQQIEIPDEAYTAYDLVLNVLDLGPRLALNLKYNQARCDEATAHRWMAYYLEWITDPVNHQQPDPAAATQA
jgi:hypothetical protein